MIPSDLQRFEGEHDALDQDHSGAISAGRAGYASDMADAEWALIRRLLPRANRRGPPRKTKLRRVVEAILYIVSTGCQWRALPQDFPPYSTVQGYFYATRDTGRWQRIVSVLVRRAQKSLDAHRSRLQP